MSGHCENLKEDREVGAYWELAFAQMAIEYGFSFTTHQIGRSGSAVASYRKNGISSYWTLPDVTIWTAPGQHHEIKHKYPTKYRTFGLEEYRFNALIQFWNESRQLVFYTIHDYSDPKKKFERECSIDDWKTASILKLFYANKIRAPGQTWRNGKIAKAMILYWDVEIFRPLKDLWIYMQEKRKRAA